MYKKIQNFKHFFKKFQIRNSQQSVQGDTSGDYKRALMAIVGGGH